MPNHPGMWNAILNLIPGDVENKCIAGGAVRDYIRCDDNINDIDVFRTVDTVESMHLPEGLDDLQLIPSQREGGAQYIGINGLVQVRQFTYEGVAVQVIDTANNVDLVINSFDLAICQAKYNQSSGLYATAACMMDIQENTITQLMNPNRNDRKTRDRAERFIARWGGHNRYVPLPGERIEPEARLDWALGDQVVLQANLANAGRREAPAENGPGVDFQQVRERIRRFDRAARYGGVPRPFDAQLRAYGAIARFDWERNPVRDPVEGQEVNPVPDPE